MRTGSFQETSKGFVVVYKDVNIQFRNNSVEHTTVTKKPSGWQKYDSPSCRKLPSGKHNTINILLTGELPVMGEYSVEVAVQTVNLLPSGSGGSTPSSPIRRVEKWQLARLITLRSAVQIRLLQFVECTLVAN